jgi:hypothetical protein
MQFFRKVFYIQFSDLITKNISDVTNEIAKNMAKLVLHLNDEHYKELNLDEDNEIEKFDMSVLSENYSNFMKQLIIIPYQCKIQNAEKKRVIEEVKEEPKNKKLKEDEEEEVFEDEEEDE